MATSFRDARDPALAAVGVLVWWTVGWLAVGPSFEPGGPVFALYVLLVVSTVAGRAAGRLRPVPPLVGQLLAGCLLRNLPVVGPAVGAAVHPVSSASARTAALGVILARAGLSLDVAAVWRLRWPVSRLAFAPFSLVEAWRRRARRRPRAPTPSLHTPSPSASSLAGISPAVVIPSVLSLQERGYGVQAGVPALITTAASVDVVFAIAGFGAAARRSRNGEAAARRGGVARARADRGRVRRGIPRGPSSSARPRWRRLRFWSARSEKNAEFWSEKNAEFWSEKSGVLKRESPRSASPTTRASGSSDGRGAPGAFWRRARGTDRRRGVGGGRGVGDTVGRGGGESGVPARGGYLNLA